ncbi:hypothetical protein PR202_ga12467 [Eleusine coracana subsp. coracana]|uniref:DUF4216 domain-containing protein n=1 Tax=Eleusine coracana subsp. coracana TaxID=191504 RepID=A0AAV5CBU1_ELECO|nr:hypothetical protein PR202_ga12467 [Eleusine coracana subsp. coracana]
MNYHHQVNVVLFKCDWVDNHVQNKWVKTNKFGIITVNFKHLFNTGEKILDEPFILASQAAKVYYVSNPFDTESVSFGQPKPRDLYGADDVGNEILGAGNKMPSVGENSNAASLNEYEQQRLANVKKNKERLADLKIHEAANDLAQQCWPKKIGKKKRNESIAITDPPNLRPRPRRNYAQFGEERVLADLNPVGDFLGNNEDTHNDNQSNVAIQKRKGRGVTKKDDIFSRKPDMPKSKSY